MTEIHNNDLASIVAALTELTQKVEAIRPRPERPAERNLGAPLVRTRRNRSGR